MFQFLLGMWKRKSVTSKQIESYGMKGFITKEQVDEILTTKQN